MDGGAVPDLTMRNQPEVRLSLSVAVAVAVCLIGAPSMAGARLAVKQLNARGGFLGRPVELLGRDGLSDPALVAAATRELIHAPGLSAITGLNDTSMVLAAAPPHRRWLHSGRRSNRDRPLIDDSG